MKHIGHVDGATDPVDIWKTHSLGMLSPHDLFIPNPGERENVDAGRWRHVGWVQPDKDGGYIWNDHADAGDGSRPAYIQRQPKPTNGRIFIDKSAPHADQQPLFTVSTDDLIKEALEFCTELDDFEGPAYDSAAEVCCQRANVYILELVRRLQTDKITVSRTHAAINDPMDVRRSEFEALAKDVAALANIIVDLTRQSQSAPAEPPMTFYDHAFIACAAAGMSVNGVTKEKAIRAAKRLAHDIAENRPT